MKFLYSLVKTAFCVMSLFSQDLPIQNGELEQTIPHEKSLDLSKLSKGLYIIQIQHKGIIQNFKVFIN